MAIQKLFKMHGYLPTGDYSQKVEKAESDLGINFAIDFKEYLINYGQLTIETDELTGVLSDDYLNVVNATFSERKYLLPEFYDMYVIFILGIDGIVIWQKTNGEIYQTVPNGVPEKIHDSFYEYLEQEVFI